MKICHNYSIVIILTILNSLLDGYYNLCQKCGRVLSFKDNRCPYCSDIKKRESNNFDEISPIEILKTRYAKGEITKKEFQEIKKDLEE